MTIPNLLAERYACEEMRAIWSPKAKVRRERQFWVTVLEEQIKLGAAAPQSAPGRYRAVLDQIDMESIRRRERRLRHDVMARLEEFCELAGCEYLHWGLTSRDVTENVEQTQVRDSLRLVLTKAVAAVGALAQRAADGAAVAVVARTHNVPAQATTFGRRLAAAGEELIGAVGRLERVLDHYPLRGLKGPVGTQADLLRVLSGDHAKVDDLEAALAQRLGFPRVLGSVGQVYPRSLDLDVVSALVGLAAGPANLATTIRLMAGHDLITEGFAPGQVGSSAMPQKVNARSCERICGLAVVLRGHLSMAAELAGGQWNEGDVSCSVVRRVVLADSFFAVDGLLEAFLTVAAEMQVHGEVAAAELEDLAPLLAGSALLVAATEAGADRTVAHEALQRHSAAAMAARRAGDAYDMATALGNDPEIPLTAEMAADVVRGAIVPGRAQDQVDDFVRQAGELLKRWPEARGVVPRPLL